MRESLPTVAAPTRCGHRLAQIATAIWALALATGTLLFVRYQFTPGDETRAPLAWPADSALTRDPSRPTLVLFAHPGCSCTRATLAELQVVMSRVEAPFTAQVVFVQLPGVDAMDTRDGSWEEAGRVPGLERRVDVGGVEAGRFAALVSGYTVLYDTAGRLAFEGGITASRGHVGPNVGRSSLISLLRHERTEIDRTHVFGCLLFDRVRHADELHAAHEAEAT